MLDIMLDKITLHYSHSFENGNIITTYCLHREYSNGYVDVKTFSDIQHLYDTIKGEVLHYNIYVCEDDMMDGELCSSENCAISKAIKRTIPDADKVWVDYEKVTVNDVKCIVPDTVFAAAQEYDCVRFLEPFWFELKLPVLGDNHENTK